MQNPLFSSMCSNASYFSSFLVALAATIVSSLFATVLIFRKAKLPPKTSESNLISCNCVGDENEFDNGEGMAAKLSDYGGEMAVEMQTGASMLEQLVPEITTHALGYLDFRSLCRLSMTNSVMRKAAYDDSVWKALYHKDFTLEQDNVTPPNGWKAYYATTRAILNMNTDFFRIVREMSLTAMSQFWLRADYVKCFHPSSDSCSGYNRVMKSWKQTFFYEGVFDYQIRDVRTRVLADVAWVTMRGYIGVEFPPLNVSNTYEFHNGRWYMVHHHSSFVLIEDGDVEERMQ
ncbi:hypothetical protein RD792_009014 [Penstemon davidsonii]|uniref:F-box domain-containing protein n=1 Tax=Penstemon davidsonii TaxID=160366 RepID=A0ABR0DC30_9LAMI|nr:hypothetical protein RD792_009014 [Penstemon davidsonii]